MNNPLFENPYQWVVVLFPSKKQISGGKKNHSYFLFNLDVQYSKIHMIQSAKEQTATQEMQAVG
jgi:hypothetical protein